MKQLNRYDKLLMIFILITSILLYASMEFFVRASTSGLKVAVVSYRNEEILRIDMSLDANYTVDGTLGEVLIEVLDQKIRIEKETSPYHLCSIQGWVEYANVPIVCLPNHIVVMIEGNYVSPHNEDSVIQ